MNGFKKMQRRLRKEGWYVEWALPCCENCGWMAIPLDHEEGPCSGSEVDLSKVLFNHEQDCEIVFDWDDEKEEQVVPAKYKRRKYSEYPHYTSDEVTSSKFCFDGSRQGVKNLKAIVPIIEECGCKIDWNGKGDKRPTISWSD